MARGRELEGGPRPRLARTRARAAEGSFLTARRLSREGVFRRPASSLRLWTGAEGTQAHRSRRERPPSPSLRARQACGPASIQQAARAQGGARCAKRAKWPPRGRGPQEDAAKP